MRFLDWIIEELEDAAGWFREAYYEVKDWIWPFYLLKYPMYGLYGVFHWLAQDFEDFNEWVDDAARKIRDILDFGDIWGYFRTWFEYAQDAWNWVRYAFDNVFDIITDWWKIILPIVKGYIDIATEGFDELVEAWDTFWKVTWPEWTGNLRELRSIWDNFWTITFPTLVSFDWLGIWWNGRLTDIQALLNTAIQELAPFWEGWQEIRDQVLEFFADPWGWLEEKFTDWFLGPEE